jgi:hypothetical protein
MQYAQNSFLSFLTTGVKQGFIDPQVKADVYNPTKFSPLLKSELAKTLSGFELSDNPSKEMKLVAAVDHCLAEALEGKCPGVDIKEVRSFCSQHNIAIPAHVMGG